MIIMKRIVFSLNVERTPCSACSVLSASLLACLYDFIHVPRWPNLENVAIRQSRMLADELYSMIQVSRLEHENAAELFFGFGIGAVGRCHFAVLPREGQGGFRRLKRFSTGPVPAGAKMVVIFKACIEHGVSLALSHAIEFAFVVVAKTDVFHCSSPLPSGWEPAGVASRWLLHPLVKTVHIPKSRPVRLFRCSLRV